MKRVGVVGLGYVGLPLAVQAAQKGYKVQGIDLDSKLVATINRRISPFVKDVRFEASFAKLSTQSLSASTTVSDLAAADIIVICVPTPTTYNVPDLSLVQAAARSVASILKKGQLILLESTVNPGVTRNLVLPTLEHVSGLTVGKDFYLAYCPERIDPGNQIFFVGNLNRVIGGITAACLQQAHEFYSSVIDANIITMGSVEEAEFVKSWENSHRNVMIALANSAAIICDAVGMNIDTVLKGLQSKVDQFGLHLAKPGIGPGGHCIPEDIHYVIKNAKEKGVDTKFLDAAARLNEKMPRYALQKLSELIAGNGERLEDLHVLLLGIAYKPNVADIRRSPAIELGRMLSRKAKKLSVHDPYAAIKATTIKGAEVVTDLAQALTDAEVVVIGCGHSQYLQDNFLKNKAHIRYVYDGRNCLNAEVIRQHGILYKGVGK